MTRKGAFFIAGSGGPASMWSQRATKISSKVGSGILPADPRYAREILEQQDEFEWLEKIFGAETEAGDSETSLLIRMPWYVRQLIEANSKKEGISMNQYCINVLANS